jgi:rod shape-determining protein MreC
MENLLSRYRNVCILVGVLFAQILGLAIQVRRVKENNSTLLIRVWTVGAITPLEKGIVDIEAGVGNIWHNYIYLHGVRQENRQLRAEIQQLRLDEVRLNEDAQQAHRLQLLLGFKERYLSQTLAAQVIGSGGSDQSRVVYIDKGADADLKLEMPVITADGVVGKIIRVDARSSQVLLVSDQNSGAGAITEKSRSLGVVRGTADGRLILDKVMSDEQVETGERVLTSGGDRIFPKGMPIGVVADVSKGKDSFLTIRIKSAANLNKLEEVLVITKQEDKVPSLADAGVERASDILARRLPSVPDQPPADSVHKPVNLGTNTASAPAGQIAGKEPAANTTNVGQVGAPIQRESLPVNRPIPAKQSINPVIRTITDESPAPAPVKTVQREPSSTTQAKPVQPEATTPEGSQQ